MNSSRKVTAIDNIYSNGSRHQFGWREYADFRLECGHVLERIVWRTDSRQRDRDISGLWTCPVCDGQERIQERQQNAAQLISGWRLPAWGHARENLFLAELHNHKLDVAGGHIWRTR